MGTPMDAASYNTLKVREVMRLCAGCEGVVNVPLHHLDGEHHLACIPGRASQALLDENGLVVASVEAEVVGMTLDETCFAHPVRTVAQRVIWSRPKSSARETFSGLPSSPGGTGMWTPPAQDARGSQQRPVPVARMVSILNDNRSNQGQLNQSFKFP